MHVLEKLILMRLQRASTSSVLYFSDDTFGIYVVLFNVCFSMLFLDANY